MLIRIQKYSTSIDIYVYGIHWQQTRLMRYFYVIVANMGVVLPDSFQSKATPVSDSVEWGKCSSQLDIESNYIWVWILSMIESCG